MTYNQRRGTAIVETNKGILLTAGRSKIFLIPGGKARRNESRMQAAIRELKEETRIEPYFAMALFRFKGRAHTKFQDYHTVYYVKAKGKPRPGHEVKFIDYFKPDCNLRISSSTRGIINKFQQFKESNHDLFRRIGNL